MMDPVRITDRMDRARDLIDEADALCDRSQALWRRIWYARRAKELVSQAEDMLDEAALLMGAAPNHDGKPERYGPFTRRHLLCLQWFIGIWNALTMVWAIVDGRWLSAVFSLASMFVCTLWVLPRKPRKTHL